MVTKKLELNELPSTLITHFQSKLLFLFPISYLISCIIIDYNRDILYDKLIILETVVILGAIIFYILSRNYKQVIPPLLYILFFLIITIGGIKIYNHGFKPILMFTISMVFIFCTNLFMHKKWLLAYIGYGSILMLIVIYKHTGDFWYTLSIMSIPLLLLNYSYELFNTRLSVEKDRVFEIKKKEDTQQELECLNYLYRGTTDNVPIQLATLDIETFQYVMVNKLAFTGQERSWIIGKTDIDYFKWLGISERIGITRIVHMKEAIDQVKNVEYQEKITYPNSETRIYKRTYTPIKDKNNKLVNIVMLGEDITALVKAHQKLNRQANTDELTKLYNRFFIKNELKLLIEDKRNKFSLLFIDLNKFKKINDTYGHSIGDKILVHVANTLKKVLRTDDIIARLGGDEFAIILKGIIYKTDIHSITKKIFTAFIDPFNIPEKNITICPELSIGVSRFPKNGTTVDQLLHNADNAMYLAKSIGVSKAQIFDEFYLG